MKNAIMGLGMLVAACAPIQYEEDLVSKVNSLSSAEYISKTKTVAKSGDGTYDINSVGKVTVFGDYVVTAYHVVSNDFQRYRTPVGYISSSVDKVSETTTINDQPLNLVINNNERDYTIFNIKGTELCEQICNDKNIADYVPSDQIYVGMPVEFIASPNNIQGFYVQAKISKIIRADEDLSYAPMKEPAFFIDRPVIGGTSGTIVYHKGKPMGLLTINYGAYGGGIFIDDLVKDVREHKERRIK